MDNNHIMRNFSTHCHMANYTPTINNCSVEWFKISTRKSSKLYWKLPKHIEFNELFHKFYISSISTKLEHQEGDRLAQRTEKWHASVHFYSNSSHLKNQKEEAGTLPERSQDPEEPTHLMLPHILNGLDSYYKELHPHKLFHWSYMWQGHSFPVIFSFKDSSGNNTEKIDPYHKNRKGNTLNI